MYLTLLLCCSKEKENNFGTIRGLVVHVYTQKPITNFSIEALKSTTGLFGSTYETVGESITDINGSFQITINNFNASNRYSFSLGGHFPANFDTTQKFFAKGIRVTDFNGVTKLELYPRGYLFLGIEDSIFTDLNLTKIKITSPYETDSMSRGGHLNFYVDADKNSMFKFQLIGNNLDTTVFRQIYVQDFDILGGSVLYKFAL